MIKFFVIAGIIAVGTGVYLGRTTSFEMRDRAPEAVVTPEYKAAKEEEKALKELPADRLPIAIAKMKKEVVERLRYNESHNFVVVGNKIFMTFDPQSSMREKCATPGGIMNINCLSFGPFQMKVGTIQMWYKQLGKGDIDDMDAMNLAISDSASAEFAEEVIFAIKGSIWHWAGATGKDRQWFDTRITLIRELEAI